MFILARHGETPANAARKAGSAESRVQGFSKEMPLAPRGRVQASALGLAAMRFITKRRVEVASVHSSDAERALHTRTKALAAAGLSSMLQEPDVRLRELCKGNLEGMLRNQEAYPTDRIRKQQAEDWHFRHGSRESGGESALEAGLRWLDWFGDTVHTLPPPADRGSTPAILAFGHNLVTAYGVYLLTHPEVTASGELPSLTAANSLKVDNGTALVLTEQAGTWVVDPERIVPTSVELTAAAMSERLGL